jgi:tetratricopeptide (TPR) repeat protein
VVVLGAVALAAASRAALADYKQAVAFYNQQRFDRVIQELKPDLDSNPDWEFGHRLVGLSYLALKNNALAVSSLSRAVQLKSTTASTYIGLAQAYFNMKRYDNVVQTLNQGDSYIQKSAEDRYKAHHLKGSAQYAQERYAEAANELTSAIREKSGLVTDWTVYSQLGIAYFNLKKYDEAIQALTKALALKQHSGTAEFLGKAYFKKGVAALASRQYDAALDSLKKARDASPKDGFIHYNMGEAYLFQKNYGEAERAYNQALEMMPKSAEVFQRLGLVYEKQKKWDLAFNAYQKANELQPNVAVVKEALARVTEAKKGSK